MVLLVLRLVDAVGLLGVGGQVEGVVQAGTGDYEGVFG